MNATTISPSSQPEPSTNGQPPVNASVAGPATAAVTPREAKLPASTQLLPTDEELFTLDTYAETLGKIKALEREAEDLKGDVVAIVNRCGPLSLEHGRLVPSDSNSYPIPTVLEWNGRITAQRELVASLPAGSVEQRAAHVVLDQMNSYTHFVVEFHETSKWEKEIKAFFVSAGVVIPIVSPGVKRLEVKPPPRRSKVPSKASEATPDEDQIPL